MEDNDSGPFVPVGTVASEIDMLIDGTKMRGMSSVRSSSQTEQFEDTQEVLLLLQHLLADDNL